MGAAQADGSRDLTAAESKLHQLQSVQRAMEDSRCEWAADDASIEGCRQLEAKVHALEAEIESLKSRAVPGPEKQPAGEAGAPAQIGRPYTYPWRTKPNVPYRTLCVRLCDGFYFPVGNVSRPADFLADERACRSSCSASAKLFYQTPSSDDAGDMLALTGERYVDLPNAFRYRSEYLPHCACKPEPWSPEAKADYARRGVLAARNASARIVAAGAASVANVLATRRLEVAERRPRVREAKLGRVKLEPYPAGRGLFWRFRSARHAESPRPRGLQARNEPRRFFLFRDR
jgi:hypothetical protein